jgi:hypothetical protein
LTGIGVLGALQERANKNQQKGYDNSFEEEKSLLGGRRSEDEETDVNDSVSIYSKKGPKFSTVASP